MCHFQSRLLGDHPYRLRPSRRQQFWSTERNQRPLPSCGIPNQTPVLQIPITSCSPSPFKSPVVTKSAAEPICDQAPVEVYPPKFRRQGAPKSNRIYHRHPDHPELPASHPSRFATSFQLRNPGPRPIYPDPYDIYLAIAVRVSG